MDAKDVVLAFYKEVFENKHFDVIEELCAPDIVEHTPMPGQPESGLETARWIANTMTSAFSDISVTVDDVISEGDHAAVRNTFHGTHTGELMGIPPTGKRVSISNVDIIWSRNGKATDHWGYMDTMQLMVQLGVAPPMP